MEMYLNVHHSIKQLSVNLCVAVRILVVGLFLYPVIDPPFPKVLEILYLISSVMYVHHETGK